MACACKVNQQLSYIQKKYGVNGKETKGPVPVDVKMVLMNLLSITIAALLSPFMFILILFRGKKVINVSKVFGLSSK